MPEGVKRPSKLHLIHIALTVGLVLTGMAPCARAEANGAMTLSEAYRAALRLSEQVQLASGNEALAETLNTSALTIMGPQATITANGFYQNSAAGINQPGLPQGAALQTPYAANIRATLIQPLFRRQIFDARRAAELGVAGAQEALHRAKQQLMIDVTVTFVAVLQARQQHTIAQAAVKRAETQLTSANARVKAGGALPTAVLLAQIELNRAQILVNNADGFVRQQESLFERFVGQKPPAVLTLPATPSVPRLDDALSARDDRADLRSLHYATLQARATVSTLQGRIFWPTLDLQLYAGYSINGNALKPPDDFRFPSYGLAGVLTIPLFQSGDEWVQVKLQRQRAIIAATSEALQHRIAGNEVRQANARLEIALRGIEIATEQHKTAQQNYQLVSNHYKLGVATLLEVVTAQSAAFEAETNKALAQFERELATYQLLFATGKLEL